MSDAFCKSSFFLNYSTLLYDRPTAVVGELCRFSRLIGIAFV